MSLREIEKIVEMIVEDLEVVQAVANPGGGSRIGIERPGFEIGDVVLELRNQGMRSAGKTDGTDVMREGRLGRSFVRKRERSPENADHGCDINFDGCVESGKRN